MNKTIGIIGFGAFGQFIESHLKSYFKIVHFDPISEKSTPLAEICKSDFVILAMPVQKLEEVLIKIKDLLSINTVVIDVCSIKVQPLKLMQQYLPSKTQYLATHPLFGPKSGANGIKGLNIAICEGRIDPELKFKLTEFLKTTLELKVIETTADDHDYQMAYVQGLTHFIARGLNSIKLPENLNLTTATFEHLIKLKDIVGMDSEELFKVIQNSNPHSKNVRKIFLESLNSLGLDK
jgi:prephenate dehydrogenase